MKKSLFISVVLVFCPILATAQQPSSANLKQFQLVSAIVTDPSSPDHLLHIVLLVDTQTGSVWRFLPLVGGSHTLKPQDQYTDANSTVEGVSPGAFVPVQRIEFENKTSKPN